jgi:hypothetical protein
MGQDPQDPGTVQVSDHSMLSRMESSRNHVSVERGDSSAATIDLARGFDAYPKNFSGSPIDGQSIISDREHGSSILNHRLSLGKQRGRTKSDNCKNSSPKQDPAIPRNSKPFHCRAAAARPGRLDPEVCQGWPVEKRLREGAGGPPQQFRRSPRGRRLRASDRCRRYSRGAPRSGR